MGLHQKIREAKNPLTTPERLAVLARCGDRDVLEAIVRNEASPLGLLEELMRSRSEQVQQRLARSKLTTPEMLTRLAESEHPKVLADVAENRRTPAEVLDRLSHHEVEKFVALNVASNPSTAAETLQRLVRHPNRYVRFRLAGNPSMPQDTFLELARDPDRTVGNRLADRKDVPEEVFGHFLAEGNDHTLVLASRCQSAPEWFLLTMLGTGRKEILRMVAGNRSSSTAVLQRAAEVFHSLTWDPHDHRDIRHVEDIANHLAGHPNTTLQIADGMPAKAIGKWSLGHWYHTHPQWDAIEALHQEWEGTLGELVDTVEAFERTS